MNIVFTDTFGVSEEYRPVPAARIMPDWYRHVPSKYAEMRDIEPGNTPHTVKKCVPVLDAISAGYLILSHTDIYIHRQDDGLPYYRWGLGKAIEWHPLAQAPGMPHAGVAPIPKFMNPWAVRTDPGTSVLIINPMHREESPIQILPGVVDTDEYVSPVNFPFVLKEWDYEGMIPAGTPIAQVIPFVRETWQMRLGGPHDLAQVQKTNTRLRSLLLNGYRLKFWKRKRYA